MAVRPSRRPHRDQSPYITLKWHRPSPSRGPLSQEPGGGPVGRCDLAGSPCGFSAPQQCEERAEQQTVVQRSPHVV